MRRTVVQIPAEVVVGLDGLHHEADQTQRVQQAAEAVRGRGARPLLLQRTLAIAQHRTHLGPDARVDIETQRDTLETQRDTLRHIETH